MEEHKCLLCDSVLTEYNYSNNVFYINCPNCGKYYIEKDDKYYLGQILGNTIFNNQYYFNTTEKDKELNKLCNHLSSYIFELNKKGRNTYEYPTINESLVKILFKSNKIPRTPDEKVEKLLYIINNKTEEFGVYVKVVPIEAYLSGKEELNAFVKELLYQGLITVKQAGRIYKGTIDHAEINHSHNAFGQYAGPQYNPLLLNKDYEVSLTLAGIGYIRDKKTGYKKDKCFVAMWFNPSMDKVFNEAISPACKEAGFFPVRIDKKEHNNDINDEIIKEINSASFVVADLTGFRGGVYYEAGYARGLGKEVILCCKEQYEVIIEYPEMKKPEKTQGPHFDVNHINTIYWKEDKLETLKSALKNRILATFGQGEYMEETNA